MGLELPGVEMPRVFLEVQLRWEPSWKSMAGKELTVLGKPQVCFHSFADELCQQRKL